IDMYPLMVFRGVGELVDARLANIHPLAHPDFLADQRLQFAVMLKNPHCCPLLLVMFLPPNGAARQATSNKRARLDFHHTKKGVRAKSTIGVARAPIVDLPRTPLPGLGSY